MVKLKDVQAPVKVKTPRAVRVLTWTGFIFGILAVIPYLSLQIFYLIHNLFGYHKIMHFFGSIGAEPGFFVGVPFGLTAVITGAISLSKKPANSRNTTLAILAVLLGIGGIIGHFWYFATCQFCQ